MNMIPTETRLLGLTPRQYTLLKERSKEEALRLHREAIAELADAIARWLRAALAAASRAVHQASRPRIQQA